MNKHEAGAKVYNAGYRKGGYGGMYHVHYTKSPYFKSWRHIINSGWLRPEDKILDLGCGPGQFAHMLKDHGFINYVGVDFSKEAIKQASKRVPNWDFRCENIYDLEVTEDFDVIVALEVLEHLKRDLQVLRKMPPGKRFVFSVPNFNSKNHVRYFRNAEGLKKRYSGCCDIEKLDRISRRKAAKCLWLFHGTFLAAEKPLQREKMLLHKGTDPPSKIRPKSTKRRSILRGKGNSSRETRLRV